MDRKPDSRNVEHEFITKDAEKGTTAELTKRVKARALKGIITACVCRSECKAKSPWDKDENE